MKKALSFLLIFAIVMGICPMFACAVSVSDFTDLPAESSWAYEGIAYCIEKGYMNGTGENTFSPKGVVTRGQLVTMLYRIEGEPETEFKGTFDDVPENAYYAKAVEWAFANGIVLGVDLTHFAPKDNITRQQIAAILHRYCGAPLPESGIEDFPDAGKCQLYAVLPMSWCVSNGLINGVAQGGESYLKPRDTATRDQIAAIIMRLIKNVVGEVENPEESEPSTDSGYLEAYAEILRAELEEDPVFARFCLAHIDGDEIPELVISPAWVTMAVPVVYTYYNDEAVQVGSFGSMGGLSYADQQNVIHSAYTSMGYSTNGFYQIVNGTYETIAYFEDNKYAFANEEKYFKINDSEVSETEYYNKLEEYNAKWDWTKVDYYDTCHEVSEANIELMLSAPENFILVP